MTERLRPTLYLVADPKVTNTVDFAVGEKVAILGPAGIEPVDTCLVSHLTGYRQIEEIDTTQATCPEFASRFGYSSFSEMPAYLKSVWNVLRGDAGNAVFYAKEAGVSERELECIEHLSNSIKKARGS